MCVIEVMDVKKGLEPTTEPTGLEPTTEPTGLEPTAAPKAAEPPAPPAPVISSEEHRAEIASLRQEAGSYRAKAREAEKRAARAEIGLVAAALGFADPTDAVRLLDELPDDVEKRREALEALAKTKPYLLRGGGGRGDAGVSGQAPTTLNYLIRSKVSR